MLEVADARVLYYQLLPRSRVSRLPWTQ